LAFTTIQGSGGAPDSFLGTAGVDVIALQNQADAMFLSARQDADNVTFTSFTNLVSKYTLYGGAGDDTLANAAGTAISDSFIAQNDGNDTITVGAVSSTTIQGNEGNDVLTLNGLLTTALANGNQGNDTINVNGGAAAGSIFSGVGFDSISVASNLSSGTRVQANQDDDTITIAAGQSINGSTINGNQGNDNIIVGNVGAFAQSTVFGGSGNDTINGTGVTTATIDLAFASNEGNDQMTGGAGDDTIFNSAGNDTITTGTGNNSVSASAGNNSVTVNAGADSVTLGSGTDTVIAGGGADTITLGAGNDTFQSTIANAQVAGLNVQGGAGTNSVNITDGGATNLATNPTIVGFANATFAASAGTQAYTFNQNFWSSGAASITLTGAADGDNDTVVINAGGVAWDAAASANAAAVAAAGDWFLQQADGNGNGTLTFWNQGTGSVTTLSIVGLDAGAVAIAGALTFTA